MKKGKQAMPIGKKTWFQKNKMEKRKKYLGQESNTDHLNVKSSPRLLLPNRQININ